MWLGGCKFTIRNIGTGAVFHTLPHTADLGTWNSGCIERSGKENCVYRGKRS